MVDHLYLLGTTMLRLEDYQLALLNKRQKSGLFLSIEIPDVYSFARGSTVLEQLSLSRYRLH